MEFTVRAKFKASAKKVYTNWLSSKGHTIMTGGEAIISDKAGDDFSAWDGYIEGRNITLDPYKRIVQSWRTTEFEAHERDSQIEIVLKEVNGETELTLIHTNLPEHGEQYRKGWDDHYFQPMQEYFSK